MLDLHCHILPGVDDGASCLGESVRMIHAAYKAGITEIVCTPHCRDPYFDFDAMWDAFNQLAPRSPIPMRMGFEVNIRKLRELGMDWAPYLCFQDSKTLLLELSTHATKRDFEEYEREIYELQGMGLDVIIAHPERYKAIQEDTSHCGAPGQLWVRVAGIVRLHPRRAYGQGAQTCPAFVRSRFVHLHR